MIIAVLLFDKAVIVVVAFGAVVTVVVAVGVVEVVVVVAVGVDAFLQKLVMEVFFSIWQIVYCRDVQSVQVAL